MLMWVVGACLKQPEDSIIPLIQLQSIVFKHETLPAFDTLLISLKFTDGDGDLGIDADETAIHYSSGDSVDINSPFYYVYDSSTNTIVGYTHYNNITLPKGYKWVDYAAYRTIHALPFDTLPGNLTCKNWEFRSSPADTLYRQLNPYNNNLFVELYTKNADGTYTFVDPADPNRFPFGLCSPNFFNSRFPVLSSDLGKKSSLEGTIIYRYQSSVFYLDFHGQTMKARIYILDRALHKSNIVESDDFVVR
jgi:hypothetical protein